MWKTNCSNKSNIFGDIATFLQQMLENKLKKTTTMKKQYVHFSVLSLLYINMNNYFLTNAAAADGLLNK